MMDMSINATVLLSVLESLKQQMRVSATFLLQFKVSQLLLNGGLIDINHQDVQIKYNIVYVDTVYVTYLVETFVIYEFINYYELQLYYKQLREKS